MKLIKADYFAMAALLMFIIAHGSTQFIINYYSSTAEQLNMAEDAALMFEANPVTKHIFRFENIRIIYSFIIMPAIFFASYYSLRFIYRIKNPKVLEYMSVLIFLFAFLNAINDVSILMAVLMK